MPIMKQFDHSQQQIDLAVIATVNVFSVKLHMALSCAVWPHKRNRSLCLESTFQTMSSCYLELNLPSRVQKQASQIDW